MTDRDIIEALEREVEAQEAFTLLLLAGALALALVLLVDDDFGLTEEG